MQDTTSKRTRPVYVEIDESVYQKFKELITHRGQFTYEIEQALIDRIKKLEEIREVEQIVP